MIFFTFFTNHSHFQLSQQFFPCLLKQGNQSCVFFFFLFNDLFHGIFKINKLLSLLFHILSPNRIMNLFYVNAKIIIFKPSIHSLNLYCSIFTAILYTEKLDERPVQYNPFIASQFSSHIHNGKTIYLLQEKEISEKKPDLKLTIHYNNIIGIKEMHNGFDKQCASNKFDGGHNLYFEKTYLLLQNFFPY